MKTSATDNGLTNVIHERIDIPGVGRRLEGLLAYPDDRPPAFGALIAGPHPFLGGDLQNNLVQHLLAGVAAQGGLALTFHYGGVGESEGGPDDWPAAMSAYWRDGIIDEERDWIQDGRSAYTTIRGLIPPPPVVIGYSFGCWVASDLTANPGAGACVLISPNPTKHAFDSLNDTASTATAEPSFQPPPLLVVCSDNDFTCATENVKRWYDRLRQPKSFALIRAGEHFFRGCEGVVLDAVTSFLKSTRIIRKVVP